MPNFEPNLLLRKLSHGPRNYRELTVTLPLPDKRCLRNKLLAFRSWCFELMAVLKGGATIVMEPR